MVEGPSVSHNNRMSPLGKTHFLNLEMPLPPVTTNTTTNIPTTTTEHLAQQLEHFEFPTWNTNLIYFSQFVPCHISIYILIL